MQKESKAISRIEPATFGLAFWQTVGAWMHPPIIKAPTIGRCRVHLAIAQTVGGLYRPLMIEALLHERP